MGNIACERTRNYWYMDRLLIVGHNRQRLCTLRARIDKSGLNGRGQDQTGGDGKKQDRMGLTLATCLPIY